MASREIDLVCFGELIWDVLPDKKIAGGAPFNIVNRATALGLQAYVIGSVGKDELGTQFLEVVKQLGNSTEYIQVHPELPTSVVQVTVSPTGEPHYEIVYPVAWDDVHITEAVINLVRATRAFVFSSLAIRDPRSRKALFDLLPYAGLKICDVNLRAGNYTQAAIMAMISFADILRMNEAELAMISKWLKKDDLSRKDQISFLTEKYDYKLVIVTLGGDGAICFHQGTWYEQPVFNVIVKDTVGSGDAFLASFIYRYLNDAAIDECLKFACAVGALTASKSGGTPDISEAEITEMMYPFI